jgi:hypothetical protein
MITETFSDYMCYMKKLLLSIAFFFPTFLIDSLFLLMTTQLSIWSGIYLSLLLVSIIGLLLPIYAVKHHDKKEQINIDKYNINEGTPDAIFQFFINTVGILNVFMLSLAPYTHIYILSLTTVFILWLLIYLTDKHPYNVFFMILNYRLFELNSKQEAETLYVLSKTNLSKTPNKIYNAVAIDDSLYITLDE